MALMGASLLALAPLTVDSVFRVLWLKTQPLDIQSAVTNKEISQIIKQAVPEIQEEGDEIRSGNFNR